MIHWFLCRSKGTFSTTFKIRAILRYPPSEMGTVMRHCQTAREHPPQRETKRETAQRFPFLIPSAEGITQPAAPGRSPHESLLP